jgi:hypothetical protein
MFVLPWSASSFHVCFSFQSLFFFLQSCVKFWKCLWPILKMWTFWTELTYTILCYCPYQIKRFVFAHIYCLHLNLYWLMFLPVIPVEEMICENIMRYFQFCVAKLWDVEAWVIIKANFSFFGIQFLNFYFEHFLNICIARLKITIQPVK